MSSCVLGLFSFSFKSKIFKSWGPLELDMHWYDREASLESSSPYISSLPTWLCCSALSGVPVTKGRSVKQSSFADVEPVYSKSNPAHVIVPYELCWSQICVPTLAVPLASYVIFDILLWKFRAAFTSSTRWSPWHGDCKALRIVNVQEMLAI